MKQFAVIGLSYFGKNVLEELLELGADIMVVDLNRDAIDEYKDRPVTALVIDALNETSLRRVLPKTIDGVVIDMGDRIESSILATSYCRKIGVSPIIVKAETEEHAEILELVGATKIVFPNREAAKRITPLMMSSAFLNYLPVSGKLVIAELAVPPQLIGRTLLEANLRRKYGLNLISVKNGDEEYDFASPDYVFRAGDIALVSGKDRSLAAFATMATKGAGRKAMPGLGDLSALFGFGKK